MLIGRELERGVVDAALEDVGRGQGKLLLVAGEAGIGKTTLVDDATQRATARGHRVLWGRCWEAGGAPAFWPWTQVLRAAAAVAGDIAVPELAPPAATDEATPDQARFRLFDEVGAFLRRLAERGPLTIALDDLHVADLPSLLLLRFVARALRGVPILVLGTYRDAEARLAAGAGALLAQLARDGERLLLGRLNAQQVAELVEAQAGGVAVSPNVSAKVFDVTEGNPLFVDEMVHLLRARNGLDGSAATDVRSPLPDGIADTIRSHLALLDGATRRLLALASLFGREVAVPALTELAGGGDAFEAALATAVAAGLLVELAGPTRRVRFSHILVQETLYRDLPAGERAAIHGRIAAALGALPPSLREAQLATIAHHALASGDLSAAVAAVRAAAARATALLAFEEAARLLERALAALDDAGHGDDHLRAELTLTLGENMVRAGDDLGGRARCRAAAELARAVGDADLEARGALAYASAYWGGYVPDAVGLLKSALVSLAPGDSGMRARLLARLASTLIAFDAAEGLVHAQRAIAMARELGDAATLLAVIDLSSASVLRLSLTAAERVALDEESLSLANRLRRPSEAAAALLRLASSELDRGDVAAAERHLASHEKMLRDFPRCHRGWPVESARAMLASLRGDFAAAERASQRCIATATREHVGLGFSEGALTQMGPANHVRLRTRLDRAALAAMRLNVDAAPPGSVPSFALAWTHAMGGDGESVRHLLSRPLDKDVPTTLLCHADTCVLLEDRAAAAIAYRYLLPRSGQVLAVGPPPVGVDGPFDRPLGELALLLGDVAAAERHLRAAVALMERMGARPHVARAQYGLARTLRARGDDAAASEATHLLAAARATAVELGMDILIDWIDALAPTTETATATAPTTATATAPTTSALALRRDGEIWQVLFEGDSLSLKDSKGLRYLEQLVIAPGRSLHVAQLVALDGGDGPAELGDAGERLDGAAQRAYRRRAETLRDALDEAERFGDAHRAGRAREELDSLAEELAGAVGLGGRSRRAASTSERARVNVQRRLKDAIARIAAAHPRAGRHLEATVHTGAFCRYDPL